MEMAVLSFGFGLGLVGGGEDCGFGTSDGFSVRIFA